MTTSQLERNLAPAPAPGIGFFERFLTVWVGLCIVTGIALILTLLVMRPIGDQVWKDAFVPYDRDQIGMQEALKIAEVPISRFMLAQTSKAALAQIAHRAISADSISACT